MPDDATLDFGLLDLIGLDAPGYIPEPARLGGGPLVPAHPRLAGVGRRGRPPRVVAIRLVLGGPSVSFTCHAPSSVLATLTTP